MAAINAIRAAKPAIAPSMLKCDFGNLAAEMDALEAAQAPVIHLDVMDGHFVPNLSYGAMVIERMRELSSRPFDAHLMISEPQQYLDGFLRAGCELITIHLEAVTEPADILKQIRDADRAAGLAINPDTPVSALEPFVELVDLVLIMSVQPGFGGQSFIQGSVEKLQQARALIGPDVLLSVDGGIGKSTIAATAAAGTDIFVAGSAIFDESDYRAAIAELSSLAS